MPTSTSTPWSQICSKSTKRGFGCLPLTQHLSQAQRWASKPQAGSVPARSMHLGMLRRTKDVSRSSNHSSRRNTLLEAYSRLGGAFASHTTTLLGPRPTLLPATSTLNPIMVLVSQVALDKVVATELVATHQGTRQTWMPLGQQASSIPTSNLCAIVFLHPTQPRAQRPHIRRDCRLSPQVTTGQGGFRVCHSMGTESLHRPQSLLA